MDTEKGYRSEAARRLLNSRSEDEDLDDGYDGEDEEGEGERKRKNGLKDALLRMDFGGTGLDEAPESPRNYGIGE